LDYSGDLKTMGVGGQPGEAIVERGKAGHGPTEKFRQQGAWTIKSTVANDAALLGKE
jgi:hypothetical protein